MKRHILLAMLVFVFAHHAAATAAIIDTTPLSSTSCDKMSVFRYLAFGLPTFLEKNLHNHAQFAVVVHNPFNIPVDILSDDAYFSEGSRVLLAYMSAYKRFSPDSSLRILLKNADNAIQELTFDSHAAHGFQSYSLRDFDAVAHKKTCSEMLDVHEMVRTAEEVRDAALIVPIFSSNKKAKRVVITGCAGFLGSALVKELLKKNYEVIGLDNGICGQMKNLHAVISDPNFSYHQHDVRVPFTIEGSVDIVLHFASIPSPAMYYVMPLETLQVGLQGTLNTLHLAQQKNARYLFSSTSEVYGNPEVNPQPETYVGNVDPAGIRSQYDESKRGAETLINLFFQSHGTDIRVVRIFNTYGPGMRLSDGRVITNFVQALMHDKPLKIYGDGTQTRSFAFVTDTIDGIIRLMENEAVGNAKTMQERVFNVGSPFEFTINELAQEVKKMGKELFNKECVIVHVEQFDSTDPLLRKPDIAKSHRVLGFAPHVTLYEGLVRTTNYFMHEEQH